VERLFKGEAYRLTGSGITFNFLQMRKLFFVLFVLTSFVGCNYNNPQGRVAIRGNVILDGKPLEQGEILFSSLSGETPSVTSGASIKNGTFSLPVEHGLIPEQKYSVQFRSVIRLNGTESSVNHNKLTDSSGLVLVTNTRNIIPPQYGVNSKEIVTATKKSPNVFQFDLTSTPAK
jgi:hypothetical protein